MKHKFPLKAGDYIIFIAIAVLACGIWIRLAWMQTEQTFGEIWLDGKQLEQIKLTDGRKDTYTIEGRNGTVVIQIDGKTMWFEAADCPDHTCIRTGKISRVGQTAVCLPNRVRISITGSREGEVDVIVQ